MAKATKIAELAAKATAAAGAATETHPKGWGEVDTAVDTVADTAAPADAPQEAPATLTALASTKSAVAYGGLELDLTKLTPQGIAYLLQYGYSQSLQDSAAGAKKLATDAYRAKDSEPAAFEKLCAELDKSTDDMGMATAEEFAAAYTQQCRLERHNAIVNGTLGQRIGSAGPVDPITKLTNAIARETITNAFQSQRRKVPTGEAMTDYITRYLGIEKNFNKARAEAERRHAELQDVDLTGIL